LKHVGIEKVWRSVLEGALLEARAGNTLMARRVLKYLMHHVPWYGPLYLEAYRVERDQGRLKEALAIVEKGLKSIPRYGPLWFGAFRLCEALDMSEKAYQLPRTTALLRRATNNISRELVWKIHLDAAQVLERTANFLCDENEELTLNNELNVCRKRYAMTASTCPPNLSWKVWLASGRMELSAGNPERARALFLRAQQVVPEKGKSITLLECARLEEFVGNVDVARALLTRSRLTAASDWKIWLESVLLETRSGQPLRAIQLAREALVNHSGTGRLWACLVQLRHYDGGEEAQFSSLKRALMAVPKSGEVWCEGGRIHLNPFSNTFDLTDARRHLFFATRFTPQYGDSFLETLKLEILEQWIAPVALNMWQELKPTFLKRLTEDDTGDNDKSLAEVVQMAVRKVLEAFSLARDDVITAHTGDEAAGGADTLLLVPLRQTLTADAAKTAIDNSVLELRCSNAGPNYGLLWFHSRNGPIDTARTIIARGRAKMVVDISSSAHIYIGAMVRRFAIITMLWHQNHLEQPSVVGTRDSEIIDTDGLEELEALLDSRLRVAPSLENMLQPGKEIDGMVLLESSVYASDFVTGYAELNKFRPVETLPLRARRRALFGSDALFS
jgi:tetratricopeptide (TPR) repeat protein